MAISLQQSAAALGLAGMILAGAVLLPRSEARANPEPGAAEPALARAPEAGAASPGKGAGVGAASPVERLSEAFRARSGGEALSTRVDRVRREASRMGMRNAQPAAQGLLLAEGLGEPAERAAAAVRLAPGLPAAWGALAAAEPGLSAIPALSRGILELERNLDASVWWRATATRVAAWALVLGGTLFLLVAAIRLAPHAAHDLAHRLPGSLPPHALAALLVGIALVPAMLGEGLVGIAVGAFAVALTWAPARERGPLLLAALAIGLGLHPVTAETGRWIAALRADPNTVAIRNAEVADLSAADRERLARAVERDPASGHALALFSRRTEDLAAAERWLDAIGAADSQDPVLLNHAANVRLAAGDELEAIALYERAVRLDRRAEILFNLAQVHGSRIELQHQQHALETAQAMSPATVRELSELRGEGRLAVDLEWPVADLRGRLGRAAQGRPVADALRKPFGGGRLAASAATALGCLLLLAAAALTAARLSGESRSCSACGGRHCERCEVADAPDTRTCTVCGHPPPSDTASRLRLVLGDLALRVVPGAAGIAAERPWLGLVASFASVAAVAAFLLRDGVVTDPLVAGAAGRAAFLALATVALGIHLMATSAALRSSR